MKTFALLPHEIPPGCNAPLEAPAQCVFEWNGEEVLARNVTVCARGHAICFRHRNTNFAVCQKGKFWPYLFPQKSSPSKLQKICARALKDEMFGAVRFHLFGSDVCLQISERDAAWHKSVGQSPERFQLEAHHKDVSCALQDVNSDAHFALQWRNFSDEQKERLLFQAPPSRYVAQQIMRCCLQVAPAEFWEEQTGWTWEIPDIADPDKLRDSNSYLWDDDFIYCDDVDFPETPFGAWRHLIASRFVPTGAAQLSQKRLCARDWLQENSEKIEVRVTKPTFHEQIEARLTLENWLDQNVSPQLKTRLLP